MNHAVILSEAWPLFGQTEAKDLHFVALIYAANFG